MPCPYILESYVEHGEQCVGQGAVCGKPRCKGTRAEMPADKESLLLAGEQLLQKLSYRVTARLGGEQALDAFRSDPEEYDLVISDVTMPGMSGVEFASFVREIRADIPIVFTSGYPDPISPAEAQPGRRG